MTDVRTARKKPRSRRWLWWLVPLVSIVLAIAITGDAYRQMHAPLAQGSTTTIEIADGEHLRDVLADLRGKQVFANPRQRWYLAAWARLSRQGRRIKAGEYRIDATHDPLDLLALFISGKVVTHDLTLVEGWRFAQAWRAVSADPNLEHTLPVSMSAMQVMAAIGHPQVPAEGRFFPDTYKFPKGETDVAFLRRAYAAMHERLQVTWKARSPKLPLQDATDALILSSLIEKETALASERARIAGVFVRRLEIGMRLQTDPTVIYGLGARYHGDITKKDLRTDTPYNTYTRNGLPPTPICLPGQASLTAAVHPAQGKALYFVAKGDGSHAFSDTLAEQDAAVRRYQLNRK